MALPTAPLGQLPSMNMPYSMPTYEKGPSIWERALASFLTSAVGAATEKGVGNFMSRDSAAEFGETPASGLSRLVQGPRIDAREAAQRRAEESDMMMKNFELDSQRVRDAQRQDFEGGQATQAQGAAMDLQGQRGADDLQRTYADLQGRGQIEATHDAAAAGTAERLARIEAQLKLSDPRVGAEADYLRAHTGEVGAMSEKARAEAEGQRGFNRMMEEDRLRRAGNTPSGGSQSSVTPAMRDEMQKNGQLTPAMRAQLEAEFRPAGAVQPTPSRLQQWLQNDPTLAGGGPSGPADIPFSADPVMRTILHQLRQRGKLPAGF